MGDGGTGSFCCWQSLGHDLQLLILSVLKLQDDKANLQAMMQTSRELRLLASSLISSIEVRDAFALDHYPKLAADITSMRLWMRPCPGEAHMEPLGLVSWLQSTLTTCERLAAVTCVRVELPQPSEADTMDPVDMDSLLASIGQACPSLRCLRMDGIDRRDEDLIRAMFTAIVQHLPNIVELQLELDRESADNHGWHFNIAGIDWAACLPRGLQKFRSSVHLHHNLLQHLVQMLVLVEVTVYSLGDEATAVQSDGCPWRVLRIPDFQTWKSFGRFTAAMPSLLLCPDDPNYYWELDATSQVEAPAVAKVAAWLSQIRNCPKELSIGWASLPDTASTSTAGIISALAPLSGLAFLELEHWPVTEATMNELALALPNVGKLALESCSISSGAWLRMLSMTSVRSLTITGQQASATSAMDGTAVGVTIPLSQIVAFASDVLHPMTLTLDYESMSMADWAGWEAIKEELEEQRRDMGLPKITVCYYHQ